jgi:DNA-directed RNA polymerase
MEGPFDRAIVKQSVVSYFYGSKPGGWTRLKKGNWVGPWRPYGMTEQIVDVLKDRKRPTAGAQELAQAIYDAIGDMPVLDFLERLAELCADNGKSLRWTTPLGLPVINCYYEPEEKRIETRVNDRRRTTTLVIGNTDDVAKEKSRNSAAANFVHSADATHLQLVALAVAEQGIGMVSVHDSFGCLAPHAERFKAIIHEQFRRLHECHNLLDEVRESARAILPSHIELPPLPETGSLELDQISFFAFK